MFYLKNLHSPKVKITIIGGTGAVGAYFAMQLSSIKRFEVSIIGQKNSHHLFHLQNHGFAIETSDKTSDATHHILPEQFYYVGDDYKFLSKQDLIIVTLKQPQLTAEVAQHIKNLCGEHTLIGIVSNGLPFYFMRHLNFDKKALNAVDSNGTINEILNKNHIICINPVIASEIIKLGKIHIRRPLEKISVNLAALEINSPYYNQQINNLKEIFVQAKIPTEAYDDGAHKLILEKLQFALSINVLSAIMNQPIDKIFTSNQTQNFILYVVQVINCIANTCQIEGMRDFNDFKKIIVTPGYYSSLYQDITKHRPNESMAIIDTVLELGNYIIENNLGNLPSLSGITELRSLLQIKIKGEELLDSTIDNLLNISYEVKYLKATKACL